MGAPSVPQRDGTQPEVSQRRRRGQQLHAISEPRDVESSTRLGGARVAVSCLFPAQHVDQVTPELVAYAPLGCLLAAGRAAVWAVCALVDSPALTDSDTALGFILTSLLGVTATWSGLENLPPDLGFHVAVSNHTCVGDFLALYAQKRQYNHLIHHAVPTGGRVTRHRVQFTHSTPAAFQRLARLVKEGKASGGQLSPIHLFPEACMSSGAAVLRFSRGFALLDAPVVPIACRAVHAFGISTHTLTSSFGANLFWLCFAPWTRLSAKVLPPMWRDVGEEPEAFVQRVRAAIATELGVPMVDLGVKEKYGLKEALRAVPQARV